MVIPTRQNDVNRSADRGRLKVAAQRGEELVAEGEESFRAGGGKKESRAPKERNLKLLTVEGK